MKKKFFLLFILLLFLSVLFFLFSFQVKKDQYFTLTTQLEHYFQKILSSYNSQALMIAITLAQNEALRSALEEIDEERGHEILSRSLNYLKRYSDIGDVRAQIIAKDLTIFARSWDKEYAGMPLEGFREDLSSFTINHPKVGVETGRLLTIKATAPIKKGYKTIGYLEVISFFEPIAKQLREQGIELFVLMKSDFLDVATLMRENPTLANYVIANRNYNKIIYKDLKGIDFRRLLEEGFYKDKNFFYMLIPMYNSSQQKIGLYLLALSKQRTRELIDLQKNVSFFLQFDRKGFYDLINLWQRPQANFNSVYDRSVLEFLAKVKDEELKREFEVEAREILREYSKEELIDIILNKYKSQRKRGVIE